MRRTGTPRGRSVWEAQSRTRQRTPTPTADVDDSTTEALSRVRRRPGVVDRDEAAVAAGVHLDAHRAVRVVNQPRVGPAAMRRIECDRGEAIAGVRFPLVHAAVAVAVFLSGDEHAFGVVLDARDLAVAAGRGLDPLDRSISGGIGPCVRFAVVRLREPNLLELRIGGVVLPAVDRAVLVLVDLDTDDTHAVHVAPGVYDAVAVRVVLEQRQSAGRLVVFGRDPFAGLGPVGIARDA